MSKLWKRTAKNNVGQRAQEKDSEPRSPIRCLACGREVPEGSDFCHHCSARLVVCSACGEVVHDGSLFCHRCGAKLLTVQENGAAETTEPGAAPSLPEPLEVKPETEEPAEKTPVLAHEPSPEPGGEHAEGSLAPAYVEFPEADDSASDLVVPGERDRPDSGHTTTVGAEPSESIPMAEHRRARWPFVVAGVVVLLLAVAVGSWLWLRHGWAVYGQAHAAYREGDCRSALPLYGRLHIYPRLAGPFVYMFHREEAECVEYVAAQGLAAAGDPAGAISGWEQLRSNRPYSRLVPPALLAIVHEYSVWAGEQRQAGDFQAALATSDQLAARYPDFQAQADADVQTTYLAWGDQLRTGGEYDQAAQIYDTLAERGDPFVQPARLAWGQVMLDWAAALAGEGAYAEAEGKYRALLQREHGFLAPLTAAGGDAAGLESYGQAWTAADAPDRPLRGGPGEQYATLDVAVGPAEDALDVLGASAEPGWYAVRPTEAVSSTLSWLPTAGSGRVITGGLGIPLSGKLVEALAADSDAAARAAEGLRALYPAWATTVDPAEAAPLYAALAELATDEAAWQTAWQQALEADLEAARVLAERGEYTASISRTLEIEGYGAEDTLLEQARVLRAANRLALGDAALAAGEWERAIGEYEAVLALEEETFGVGQATVVGDGVVAREAPGTASAAVFTAPPGTQLPVAGRSGGDGTAWILLLLPAAPQAQVWIPSQQATLSVPLETLPERGNAPLPGLSGHQAYMGWLHAALGWADNLAANRDWEPALSLFQAVADWAVPDSAEATSGLDGVLHTRLGWAGDLAAGKEWQAALDQYQAVMDAAPAGSEEATSGLDGILATRLGWAAELVTGRKWTEAVAQYTAVVEMAPAGSQPAADALAGLEALATQAESLAPDKACDAVPILDALTGTASGPRAAEALPGALLQCGQTLLEKNQLTQAEAKYLRVLAEFPKSKQAAAAQRGVQRIAWMNSIDDVGLDAAAGAVCEKAGAKVQAKLSTLDKSWVAYAYGTDAWWDVPDPLSGEERQTTVVVCVGEEQQSQVEVCPYTVIDGIYRGNTYDLYRMRYYRRVRLVDPVTGLTVAVGTIYGSFPDLCPLTRTVSSNVVSAARDYTYGDHPDNDDLVAWIKKNVK